MAGDANPVEMTVLEKIEKLVREDEQPTFSEEEVTALRTMARVLLALQAFGAIGDMLRSVLVWIGLIVAVVIAVKAGFLDFVHQLAASVVP